MPPRKEPQDFSTCRLLHLLRLLHARSRTHPHQRCRSMRRTRANCPRPRTLAIPDSFAKLQTSSFGTLRTRVFFRAPSPASRSTASGLTLYRLASNDFIERSAGEVMTSFIVQGHKTTAIGGRLLEYGPGESLVCGIASPSEFHPIDASPEHPFLAISVSLDPAILMEYAGALSSLGQPKLKAQTPSGIFVIRPDEELACAFVSLLRLLDRPKLLAIRAPLLMRDLHALLLDSSCGARERWFRRPCGAQCRQLDPQQLRRTVLDGNACRTRQPVERDVLSAIPRAHGLLARAVPYAGSIVRGAPTAAFKTQQREFHRFSRGLRQCCAVRARL